MFLGTGMAIGGEGNALVDQEFGEGVSVFVSGHAENHGVAGLDVLLQAVKRRGFVNAGRAPTGPEVEENNLFSYSGGANKLGGEPERGKTGGLSAGGGCRRRR